MIAYCDRSGVIGFQRRLPRGRLRIAAGPGRALRRAVEPLARLGYDNSTLLVPGIPEAKSEKDAFVAARLFRDRVLKALARETQPRRRIAR